MQDKQKILYLDRIEMFGYLSLAYTFISRLGLQLENIDQGDIFILMSNVAKEAKKIRKKMLFHALMINFQRENQRSHHFFDEVSEITIQATGIRRD